MNRTMPKLTNGQQIEQCRRRLQKALTKTAYAVTEAFCRARADHSNPHYARLRGIEVALSAALNLILMDEGPERMAAWDRFTQKELGLS